MVGNFKTLAMGFFGEGRSWASSRAIGRPIACYRFVITGLARSVCEEEAFADCSCDDSNLAEIAGRAVCGGDSEEAS